ncbi:Myeloid-derived growth factor [Varanus komodoensis]|uniref:Myeloid derived growth factor n=1 Tax=Varanus komodoensis TaxID=61221 RepID=A0A8D2IPQ3_VARKO|nr:myeloid-derived growth factor [Varanus komodoensis]KAF7236661.1 Myeloid-derived growth factor [Varanus komodoensis]
MSAPSLSDRRLLDAAVAAALLLQLIPVVAGTQGRSNTSDFDVRPGGMVHSFSQSLGEFSCTFTYAAQGGTNEQWQISVGISEDNGLFSCSIWRPQGKSYLFFTQFKAEVKGAKIEYGMAYSTAAVGGRSDIPLKDEEFQVIETAVMHKEGKFRSELSKVLIIAKMYHMEL